MGHVHMEPSSAGFLNRFYTLKRKQHAISSSAGMEQDLPGAGCSEEGSSSGEYHPNPDECLKNI